MVVIEFIHTTDGRKAADDVREKVALIRSLLRDEVKETAHLRFDPSRVVWSTAVIPCLRRTAATASAGADQLAGACKKRLENVRASVGGGGRHQTGINLSPTPGADALGVTPTRWCRHLCSENQDVPMGTLRPLRRSA